MKTLNQKVFQAFFGILLLSLLCLIWYAIYWFSIKSCDQFDMRNLQEITDQVVASDGVVPKGAVSCSQPLRWQKEYVAGYKGQRYFVPKKQNKIPVLF